jgi:hypothetical protein
MHWLLPQQLCAVFLSFPEQPSFPQSSEHLSPQVAEASFIFAQASPSLPLQQEAASFAEQHEATSLLSFELDLLCMQACLCSVEVEADVESEEVLSQQAHFVLVILSEDEDCAGADVCAQVVVARVRIRAITLYFMDV